MRRMRVAHGHPTADAVEKTTQTPSDTRARSLPVRRRGNGGERRDSAVVEAPTRPPESAVDVKIDFKPAAAEVLAGSFEVVVRSLEVGAGDAMVIPKPG